MEVYTIMQYANDMLEADKLSNLSAICGEISYVAWFATEDEARAAFLEEYRYSRLTFDGQTYSMRSYDLRCFECTRTFDLPALTGYLNDMAAIVNYLYMQKGSIIMDSETCFDVEWDYGARLPFRSYADALKYIERHPEDNPQIIFNTRDIKNRVMLRQ